MMSTSYHTERTARRRIRLDVDRDQYTLIGAR